MTIQRHNPEAIWLIFAAFFGLTAVIAGALGDHVVQSHLSVTQYHAYQTAANYQLLHAVLLLVIGALVVREPHRGLQLAAFCLTLGILCFSGGIYLYCWLNNSQLMLLIPLGGLLLMGSWLLLLGIFVFQYFCHKNLFRVK